MTTYCSVTNKCSVCGAVSEFNTLMSTNSFGSPDLDLRPAPMQRDTMDTWIRECPECGYVAKDISEPAEIDRKFLNSEAYLTCEGLNFKSKLAVLFYRHYMIMLKHDFTKSAFSAILHAAWCCDDNNDTENARHCRDLAIPFITRMIENQKKRYDCLINEETHSSTPNQKTIERLTRKNQERLGNLLLIKADLLRRAGHFDQLITEYKDVRFSNPLLNKILAFQIEKAKQQDTECYRVANAAQ